MEALKARMRAYWGARSDSFARQRLEEWEGEKHRLWLAELNRHIPAGGGWDILDLGTGTGFLAFLLASQGHRVVGIDLTPQMIEQAGRTAQALGLSASFAVMDAEQAQFAPCSFDALVTRNLTWALPNLPQAYRAWGRLLRPGGVLLNFDGDYCREKTGPRAGEYAHRDLTPDMVAEYEGMKGELRCRQQPRPQWDVELLQQAGFSAVQVDKQLGQRIYTRVDGLYNPTPMFAIAAYRQGGV